MNDPVILASNSPRRKELLRQIGLRFVSDAADIDEHMITGESPEKFAVRAALDKAGVVAGRSEKGLVIGADTIVVLDTTVLGKPMDERDAGRMLAMLSGRMHRVMTGVAVINAATGAIATGISVTSVWFLDLGNDEIASYVGTGEPLDKAGAYGIQGKGALLVDRIEGCYFNVVGMPLSLLRHLLGKFGINLLTR